MFGPRLTAALVFTAPLAAAATAPAGARREWSRRNPERARASTPYSEAAVNAARWLSTLKRRMSSGPACPSNGGPNAPVLTGVSDGAAGIGFFFLRLNHVTRNPAYLGKARRAADHIASTQHPPDAPSELIRSPGFAAPVAS
ncbi:MAG TPA: hypothetical protein VEY09_04000 [Pyrinomonadaceae bacterium]|nr:hypothetical protein [Pyrinomonadaceae bacterium]